MEGATSISTILLVDVEVGSSPPYIYVPILLEKDITTIELSLEVPSLENPKALFGWAFGFGFWPQKPKAQPKGLFFKGAFSEAAAFP